MNKIIAASLRICSVVGLALLAGAPVHSAPRRDEGRGWNHVPESSLESPFDIGVRAHTNHVLHLRPASGSGVGGTMTPANLWSYYYPLGFTPVGSGTIAIVIAYDYPNAVKDFNAFSSMFGLPQETGDKSVLEVIYAGKRLPRRNSGWNQEAALDIEWSHAMAPHAKILLVEAQSNGFADLMAAVDVANNKFSTHNVKQLSMSWGSTEFSGEAGYDGHFQKPGIVYFASSGDVGGVVNWPSVSGLVVSVGGTSVDANGNTLVGETAWSGSGGGTSNYISKPGYQSTFAGTKRCVPDLSSDADPNTGVLVVYNGGLWQFGGTSVSSPCMAGMANVGTSHTTSAAFLAAVYGSLGTAAFYDVSSPAPSGPGWDFATGVGAPRGILP